jgi:hypothetical protein
MQFCEQSIENNHHSRTFVPENEFRLEVEPYLGEIPSNLAFLGKKDGYQLLQLVGKSGKLLAHSPFPEAEMIYFEYMKNQFVSAALQAFDSHHGFVLAPQHIFLTVLQQVSWHVNQNSEQLRSQFVKFEGKKQLTAQVPPSPSVEDWARFTQNLRQQISEATVEDTYALFSLEEFSTISVAEKVAGDITLMDVCQKYFDFYCTTSCGIPFFILEGTIEDWELLREKIEQIITRKTLPDLASRWLPAILPTLDKIVRARKGEEMDRSFWESFFKLGSSGGSGGYTFVSGWINCFFPFQEGDDPINRFCQSFDHQKIYLDKLKEIEDRENEIYPEEEDGRKLEFPFRNRVIIDGPDIQNYPQGFSKVPVTWDDLGRRRDLDCCAGFIGSKFEKKAIRPEVGWWIMEK